LGKSSHEQITELLDLAHAGHGSAADRLMPLVYDELRALAQRLLNNERRDHTLQATALVHEAYIRLVGQNQAKCEGRLHFFAVAATTLRRILVDHARMKNAEKRAACRITLYSEPLSEPGADPLDLIRLDDALRDLEGLDARQARVVELRFFAGLNVEDTAAALSVSTRTVKDDWRFAKAWLKSRLSAG
jgi:RNA polymerase sigma factor (TIGR02999 family)